MFRTQHDPGFRGRGQDGAGRGEGLRRCNWTLGQAVGGAPLEAELESSVGCSPLFFLRIAKNAAMAPIIRPMTGSFFTGGPPSPKLGPILYKFRSVCNEGFPRSYTDGLVEGRVSTGLTCMSSPASTLNG